MNLEEAVDFLDKQKNLKKYLLDIGCKGFTVLAAKCPIAKALQKLTKNEVLVGIVSVFNTNERVLLTPKLAQFREDFDDGKYPELELTYGLPPK